MSAWITRLTAAVLPRLAAGSPMRFIQPIANHTSSTLHGPAAMQQQLLHSVVPWAPALLGKVALLQEAQGALREPGRGVDRGKFSVRAYDLSLKQLTRRLSDGKAPDEGIDSDAETSVSPFQQVPLETSRGNLLAEQTPGKEYITRAVKRQVRISPTKLKLFVDVVRGMPLEEALVQCKLSVKKAARIVEQLLLSAKANAVHNHGADPSRLYVAKILVTKGKYIKSLVIHAKLKRGIMHRKYSHLFVYLGEDPDLTTKSKVVPGVLERKAMKMRRQSASNTEKN